MGKLKFDNHIHKNLQNWTRNIFLRTEITRETMDFKSTIFIFGTALIFILPIISITQVAACIFDNDCTSTSPYCYENVCRECQPLDYSTCPGSDNYCEVSAKCVSYQRYADTYCYGVDVDGDYKRYSLDDAIDGCNMDASCGCFYYNGYEGKYYLRKGTGIKDSNWGERAWVKT